MTANERAAGWLREASRDVYRGPLAEVELYQVVEVDENGLFVGGAAFDGSQMDDAFAYLEARYSVS
jgi:hypothetical protein